MSRIFTNVASLTAQRVLGANNNQLNQSLERLSTGLAINRGKDGPAALIASQNLRKDISGINSAIDNAERAERVVNIAEGGLTEVSTLLNELQGLVTSAANTAGLSEEEKEANQLQIDSILQTIDRVASSTSFQGSNLLNGNFDFQVSGQDSGIADLRVNGAKFNGDSLNVDVLVTQSAQNAGLFVSTEGTLDLSATDATFTIEVAGQKGTRQFTFSSGTTTADIATTINNFTDITGVSAVASGNGFRVDSEDFGDGEFVSVKVVDAGGQAGDIVTLSTFDTGQVGATSTALEATAAGNGIRDEGQDIGVTINGIVATTNGKTARVDSDFLNVEVTLDTTTAQTPGTVGTGQAFTITGGGADFQLAGNVDISGRVSLGISEVATRKLGSNDSGGFLDELGAGQSGNVVDGDTDTAQQIVTEAIKQVSSLRGRLGAFQRNTLNATIRSLGVQVENTAAADSVIRDTDFASETAALTRSQILSSAATQSLTLANNQPQAALQLLG